LVIGYRFQLPPACPDSGQANARVADNR